MARAARDGGDKGDNEDEDEGEAGDAARDDWGARSTARFSRDPDEDEEEEEVDEEVDEDEELSTPLEPVGASSVKDVSTCRSTRCGECTGRGGDALDPDGRALGTSAESGAGVVVVAWRVARAAVSSPAVSPTSCARSESTTDSADRGETDTPTAARSEVATGSATVVGAGSDAAAARATAPGELD